MLIGQKEVQAREARRFDELIQLGLIEKRSGIAIDGGAHIGSWTDRMLHYSYRVHAFEPCEESYDMLVENCPNALTYNTALMDKCCKVSVDLPRGKRTTLTAREVNYGGNIDAVSIDSLQLHGCDAIKLDLQGCEYPALIGARGTIKRYRPFLIVEFDDNCANRFGVDNNDIESLIHSMGYKQVWQSGVDRGFAWNNI